MAYDRKIAESDCERAIKYIEQCTSRCVELGIKSVLGYNDLYDRIDKAAKKHGGVIVYKYSSRSFLAEPYYYFFKST